MRRLLQITALTLAMQFAPVASAQESHTQQVDNSSTDPNSDGTLTRVGSAASSVVRQTGGGLADAAMSPLEDLNLRREEIPPILADLNSPYEMPHILGCLEISAMIRDLNTVLGPDWDAPKTEKKKWDERAADGAARAALNAVSSEASGMIPLRGVVRKLTRAEKHAKDYNKAFAIGGQRRAFLKGLGMAQGCSGSAAPQVNTAEDGKITYRNTRAAQPPKIIRRVVKKPSMPNEN